MEIVLTREAETLIQQKIASGAYASPSEVIAKGLRLLEEEDAREHIRLEKLRRDILAAKEQLARGEGKVYESADQLFEDIVAEGQRRLAQQRNGLAS